MPPPISPAPTTPTFRIVICHPPLILLTHEKSLSLLVGLYLLDHASMGTVKESRATNTVQEHTVNCESRSRHTSSAVEEHPSDQQASEVHGYLHLPHR